MNLKDESDLLLSGLADFVCPISGALLQNPVLADDGHNYERESIESWFRTCKAFGLAITSPWTRAVMSENLRDNIELKMKIAKAIYDRSSANGLEGVSSIHKLNVVFEKLDELRDILADTLEGWRPPQLVVIGSESSGKSSLLERLVMMPILPTAEGICTRLPIHVRLRYAPKAQAPKLEVYNLVSNRTEEGPYEVPMQSGSVDVRDKMLEVLEKEHGKVEGVSAERIIVLHVHGPHVPNLDVVDMPGLIVSPPAQRDQSRALIDRHVEQHGAYSMFLAMVPAGQRPNTSIAMEVVQAKGLEGRTLGVFTMCDNVASRSLVNVRRLLGDAPDASLGSVTLAPHGWYATMCAPLECKDGESNTARLRRQAAEEEAYFNEQMPAETAARRTTCGALVRGLSGMFLQHVRDGWAPATLQLLAAAKEAAEREDTALGLPALAGSTSEQFDLARKLATETVQLGIDGGYGDIGQACCKEMLEPLKQQIKGLVQGQWTGRAEEAAKAWAKEAAAVLEECRRAAAKWQQWWLEKARGLVVREEVGTGRKLFCVERFPKYVEAVMSKVGAAAANATAGVESAVEEAVARFYDDSSQWARFTTNFVAAQATVSVQRDGDQLVERVMLAFLRAGWAMQEGLTAAAAPAAAEVEDWAEACGEARRALLERMQKVETARAGVLGALGAESAEVRRHLISILQHVQF
jgi:hypothetical protein